MWEQIRSNHIRSVILVVAMGALLVLIGYFVGLALLGSAIAGLVITLAIWVVMSLLAFFQGDNILLALSRAKKIKRDDHPRLYNIVEEMKIASGLEKMPDIYIIDDPAPNAFATGRNQNRAAVAVTTGLLQRLNRDELQGVVGHEIGHIKNRDVLLMAMCGVLLGTIVILSWFATRWLFFGALFGGRRSSSGGGGGHAQLIVLAVGIALMILAPIFAYLIYFAISRRREYLADASSTLYTRYPEGLASALEKISSSPEKLKSANQATAPMYIINPLHKKGRAATDLSSTHPPISERVRILRSMAGGASFADYNEAYRQVHGSRKGAVPAATVASTGAIGLRAPEAEAPRREPEPTKTERTREVSDLMWKLNDYKTIDCSCGTRLKVPPRFRGKNVRCPHCGRVHAV
ncbi:MAG: M48 family metallopeptidase [Chloroflexota bacterium]